MALSRLLKGQSPWEKYPFEKGIAWPSEKEINENPPSRSAKLRYVKKSVEIYDIKTDILDKFQNLLDVEKNGESLWIKLC